VVTNAYPGITQLSAATVPLVTVTDRFVADWMGTLVNFGAVISAFGASLACGASRMLFAVGRDAGPVMLRRTSRCAGAPVGALICVGAGSLLTMLIFIKEPAATCAVAVSVAYGIRPDHRSLHSAGRCRHDLHHPAADAPRESCDSPHRPRRTRLSRPATVRAPGESGRPGA
jgi:hypothetical protein